MNCGLRRGLLVWLPAVLLYFCAGCEPLAPEHVPYTPLERAVLADDLTTVQRLLDEGADPTEATPTNGPLDIAVARGDVQMVKVLIDHGAADAPPHTEAGSYFIYLVLDRGVSTNDTNDFAVAQLLVSAGLDPCVGMKGPDFDGMLPSEIAAEEGRPDLAENLRGLELACVGR